MKINTQEFIKRATKVHNDKYDYSKFIYIKSKISGVILCPNHGEFKQQPRFHLEGSGCPKCGIDRRSNSLADVLKRFKKVHGNLYDYSKFIYTNNHTKGVIICSKHGDFLQTSSDHLHNRTGCPICAGRNKTTNDFIKEANIIHNKKYDYSKFNYTKATDKSIVICPIHGDFLQNPHNHLNGQGCRKCGYIKASNKNKKTTDDFIKRARTIHHHMFNYSSFIYRGAHVKGIIVCPFHGQFYQTPDNHLHGKRCPSCTKSKGEDRIQHILNEFRIKFDTQKRFKSCKNKKSLRFDFYIPKLKLLIEYDGGQHFKPVKWFGGVKNLDYSIKNDRIKTKWAKKNGYRLLRIPYTKFNKIEEILKENLNGL